MQKDFNKFLEYLEPRVLAYGYVRFSAAIEIFRRLVVPQALPSPTMSQESLTPDRHLCGSTGGNFRQRTDKTKSQL